MKALERESVDLPINVPSNKPQRPPSVGADRYDQRHATPRFHEPRGSAEATDEPVSPTPINSPDVA